MPTRKPLVILDRDGVLNENNKSKKNGPYYVINPGDLEIREGATEAIEIFERNRIVCCVMTKQNCIGKGMASVSDVESVNSALLSELLWIRRSGGIVVYWGADDNVSARTTVISCFLYSWGVATKDGKVNMDIAPVWVVDDSQAGLTAAKILGCGSIGIDNPYDDAVLEADYVVDSLLDAANIIKQSLE